MSETRSDVVLTEKLADHIVLVTLNRPEAKNAVDGALAKALGAAVDRIEADDDIWVAIITGAGEGVFCAGADLKAISAGRGAELSLPDKGFAGFAYSKRRKPWIAAVNGLALAGGCEIAIACDMIVATEDGAFAIPEVKRGLVAAAGGIFRLPQRIPRQIALEMVATGDRLSAKRAYELGLVNRLAPAAELKATALKLAQDIVVNAPIAVRESMVVARQSYELGEDELKKLSRQAFETIAKTEDFKEGPKAFIEKRPPRWSGR